LPYCKSFAPAVLLVLALPLAAAAPAGFDSNRAWDHLRTIVGIGPRPAGSAALETTRKYIREQLGAMGVKVADQTWDATTPVAWAGKPEIRMTNLVATIPGTQAGRIIFGGHYDTKLFKDFRFVGANDGGSSAAFLIELARVLKARKNPFTMEILFLDGEEAFHPTVWDEKGPDHTYGSRHYVEAARAAGTLKSIKAFVLVDMIGGRDLILDRESNSTPWLMDAIWRSAKKLGHDAHLGQPGPIEDDHMPFLEAGVLAVDLIDLNNYRPWHTAEDTLDKVSAGSLQTVGDILLDALPGIEARLLKPAVPAKPKH
jgi:Zn-dependent M28 family amino/carboxypeptidase